MLDQTEGFTTEDGRKIGGVVMEMKNITLRFGGVVAIQDISFDVREGEIRAIIGPNGAGKTNLMEAVSLLTPGRGMRRAPYGDLIKAGADPASGFSIFASLEGMTGPADIGTGVDGGEEGGDGREVRALAERRRAGDRRDRCRRRRPSER